MCYWVYYTDGYIYRLTRRTTATTWILHSQPRGKGAWQGASTTAPSQGWIKIVIQSSLVKWRKSAVRNPSLLKSGVFVCNLQKWMEVERESVYHTTPILEFLNDGHSNHPKLKPYQNDWYTVLLLLFFFCPFQQPEPRAPCPKSAAENPFYPKLPSWTICFSPETLNVTKRISLS